MACIRIDVGNNRCIRLFCIISVSDINILDTDVDALNISPRAGINAELGPYGDLSFFVGATYLKAEVEVAGEITFDTGLVPGEETTLSYRLIEENSDVWNGVIGANWQINQRWDVLFEVGYGGSRSDAIAG